MNALLIPKLVGLGDTLCPSSPAALCLNFFICKDKGGSERYFINMGSKNGKGYCDKQTPQATD